MELARNQVKWTLTKLPPEYLILSVQIGKDERHPSFAHIRLREEEEKRYMTIGPAYLDDYAMAIKANPLAYFNARHEFD